MPTVLDEFVTIFRFDYDRTALRDLDRRMDRVRDNLGRVSSSAFRIGAALTAAGGVAVAAFTSGARAAIEWETAFTGVRKTVNATEEEFAHLEVALRKMALQDVPLPVTELAGVAEAAGQLGISKENILEFTEVMSKLGVTTNLSADQAAMELARFANITQMSQDDFDRLGAVIVDLGNNFAAFESDISTFALRLAGAGDLVGLSQAEILGFGAALSSVGLQAEAGGTAFSRVWADMQAAVQQSSEELETFGRVAGMSGEEFADLFSQDAAAATIAFVSGLNDMRESGADVHAALEELGFDSVRIRDALLRASSAKDLFVDAVNRGTAAWRQNTALNKEAELRFKTLRAQLDFARNAFTELRMSVGKALEPTIVSLLKPLRGLITALDEWVDANPELVRALAFTAGAVLALGTVFLGLGAAVQVISFALGGFALFLKVFPALLRLVGFALRFAFGPIGWIVTAVSAAAGIIAANWEDMPEVFHRAWDGIKEAFSGVSEFFAGLFTDPVATIRDAAAGIVAIFSGLEPTIYSALAGAIQGVDFGSIGRLAGESVRDGALAVFSVLEDAWSDVVKKAAEGGILGTIEAVLVGIGDIINRSLFGIGELIFAIWRAGFDLLLGFIDGLFGTNLRQGFESALNGLPGIAQGIWDAVIAVFEAPGHIFDWIVEQWDEAMQALAGSIPEPVRKLLGIGSEAEAGEAVQPVTPATLSTDEPGFFDGIADRVGNFFFGDSPIPLPPVAPATAGGASVTTLNRSTSINVERIDVNAEGGDPNLIASQIGSKLSEQLHNAAEDFDSNVAR